MTQFQKFVKTFAIVFALLIVFAIVGAISTAIIAITSVLSSEKTNDFFTSVQVESNDTTEVLQSVNETFDPDDVDNLEINNSIGTITVNEADVQEIVISATNISQDSRIEQRGTTLYVENNALQVEIFGVRVGEKISEDEADILIEVPKDLRFDNVKIDNGIGQMQLKGITAERAKITCGTGYTECNDFFAEDIKVDAGVGEVTLNIKGDVADYDMNLTPGIGSIYVDGIQQSEMNHTNRDADYVLKVDGGIGLVNINFNH